MKPVWTPPDGLLARVRWLFLLANLVTSAVLGPLVLLDGAEGFLPRLAAVAALVWLCWWRVRGYRREAFPAFGDGFEGLALFVVGFGLDNPRRVLALLYVSTHFRALYGTDRVVVVRVLVYLAAYFGALAIAPGLPYRVVSPRVLLPALGLVLLGGVMRLVTVTLLTHERALARERVLSRVGAELVAATDRESIYRATLDAALAQVGNAPDARALLWLGSRDGLRVVAASGDRAAEAEGGSLAPEGLPEPMRAQYFGPNVAHPGRFDGSVLRIAVDFPPRPLPWSLRWPSTESGAAPSASRPTRDCPTTRWTACTRSGAGLGSTFHIELPVAQAKGDEAGGGQHRAEDVEATRRDRLLPADPPAPEATIAP